MGIMPSSHIRQVENYSLATPNLHPLNKKHERPKAVFRDRHVQVQQHVSPCACESHGPWSSPPFRSNLDIWTETVCCARELYCRNLIHALQYGINFYLDYLSRWPDLCYVQEAPSGRMMGYSTRLTLRVSPIDFHSLPHKKKKNSSRQGGGQRHRMARAHHRTHGCARISPLVPRPQHGVPARTRVRPALQGLFRGLVRQMQQRARHIHVRRLRLFRVPKG